MHIACETHGDCGFRFRFGCRHVLQASRVAGSPIPVIDDRGDPGIVCRECLTSRTKDLIDTLRRSYDSTRNCDPDRVEVEIKPWFDCHEQLRIEIGYVPVCLECLYENTGLDRRTN
jgi:hypothetical protein